MNLIRGGPIQGLENGMIEHRAYRIGYLSVEGDGHIAVVTMDRANKLNAMTAGFWKDLRDVLDRLAADSMTRVVIITGAGETAFSAGGDIASFIELETIEEMRAYQVDAMATYAHLERSPLIIIAAVNGLAFGGGFELALASDIVIAADTASFALPEARLGLVPGFGAIRCPDVLGRQMTKYLIASGDSIDADRALAIGLVQLVVSKSELLAQAKALAGRITERSPLALTVAKRMVNRSIDAASFDYSVDEITALQSSDDRAQGVEAFLNGQTPDFGRRQQNEQ